MPSPTEPPAFGRIVAVNAAGEVSGAEAVLLDVLALARADGIDVVVASPAGPLVDRLSGDVRHVELPPFGLGGARGVGARSAAAARWAARTPAAVVALRRQVQRSDTLTLVNSLLALPAVRLARPATTPAWLVHDTVHSGLQRAVVRSATWRRPWTIVAVSEATAAPLRRMHLDVAVRPNGVAWPVDPAPDLDGDPPVVGSLALLTSWKGQQVLLDAVAGLPGVRCELAGGHFPSDADYVAELRRRAAEPDLDGRVALLGHVDALETLRGWDVMVSASTSPEAGPLAVLEAMALGVPVVATDHGGSAEYLADGGGLLVPPGDAHALRGALAGLLADRRLRRRLGAEGRASVAARYDRSRTLPALYAALVGGRAKGGP
jgi:glycosyltransferase involved in cell wall biosynthesis